MLMQCLVSPVQLAALKMNPDFLNRDVNANFSGGEKKRNEILQLSVLEVSQPSLTRLCTLVACCGEADVEGLLAVPLEHTEGEVSLDQ